MQTQDLFLYKPLQDFTVCLHQMNRYIWFDVLVNKSNVDKLRELAEKINIIYCKTYDEAIKQIQKTPRYISLRLVTSYKFSIMLAKQSQKHQNISHMFIYSKEQIKEYQPKQNVTIYTGNIIELLKGIQTYNNQNLVYSKSVNIISLADQSNEIANYYRYNLHFLTTKSNHNQAFQDFSKLVARYFDVEKQLKDFSLEQYVTTSNYNRLIDNLIRMSNNLLETIYIRGPVFKIYSQIKQRFKLSERQNLTVYFYDIVDQNRLKFLKQYDGELIQTLGFINGFISKQSNLLHNTIFQIQITDEKRHDIYQEGYAKIGQKIIFNIFNVFKITKITETPELTTIKLKYGYLSIIAATQNLSNEDLAYINVYNSYTNKIKFYVHGQGNVLSLCNQHKESIQYNKLQLERNKDKTAETARSYYQIGKSYKSLGDIENAIKYQIECLNVQQDLLGLTHISVGTTLSNIGQLYHLRGDYEKAIDFFKKGLVIFQKNFGVYHILNAAVLANLGNSYKGKKQYGKAIEFYQKSILVEEKIIGVGHISTAKGYDDVAQCYYINQKYDKAAEAYKKLVEIQVKAFSKYHPLVAKQYKKIAICYKYHGEFQDALRNFEICLEIEEKIFNQQSLQKAETYSQIGAIMQALQNYTDALWFLMNCYNIYKKVLGIKNQKTIRILNAIKRCEKLK